MGCPACCVLPEFDGEMPPLALVLFHFCRVDAFRVRNREILSWALVLAFLVDLRSRGSEVCDLIVAMSKSLNLSGLENSLGSPVS